MSNQPVDAATPPPKSKKLLLIFGFVVLLLAVPAARGGFNVSKHPAALDGYEKPAKAEVKDPPVFLLGGEKVALVGITFELSDSQVVEKVKQYLPTSRRSAQLVISQRTAEELLQREALRPFAFAAPAHEAPTTAPATGAKKSKLVKMETGAAHEEPPVRGALISSFIVQ